MPVLNLLLSCLFSFSLPLLCFASYVCARPRHSADIPYTITAARDTSHSSQALRDAANQVFGNAFLAEFDSGYEPTPESARVIDALRAHYESKYAGMDTDVNVWTEYATGVVPEVASVFVQKVRIISIHLQSRNSPSDLDRNPDISHNSSIPRLFSLLHALSAQDQGLPCVHECVTSPLCVCCSILLACFPCYLCFWRWCTPSLTVRSRKHLVVSPQINAPNVNIGSVGTTLPGFSSSLPPGQTGQPTHVLVVPQGSALQGSPVGQGQYVSVSAGQYAVAQPSPQQQYATAPVLVPQQHVYPQQGQQQQQQGYASLQTPQQHYHQMQPQQQPQVQQQGPPSYVPPPSSPQQQQQQFYPPPPK
mgnify:CR=1 FL=1